MAPMGKIKQWFKPS